jgi:hypothetical protein
MIKIRVKIQRNSQALSSMHAPPPPAKYSAASARLVDILTMYARAQACCSVMGAVKARSICSRLRHPSASNLNNIKIQLSCNRRVKTSTWPPKALKLPNRHYEQCCQVLRWPFRQLSKNLPYRYFANSPPFQIFIKFRYFSAIFGLFVKVNS